jgi:hypothetical protein
VGDKTQGGGDVKKTLVKKNKNDWCKEQKIKLEKTESRMLISQQPVCGRGETRVSQAKPRQARVKESRYVIKVMNEHREGEQVLWATRTKGCSTPFNWLVII